MSLVILDLQVDDQDAAALQLEVLVKLADQINQDGLAGPQVELVGGFGVIRPRDGFCTFVNEQRELSSAATWLPSGRIVSWDQQNIRLYDPATLSECPDCALENLQPGNGVGPGAFAPLGEGVVLFGPGLRGTFVVEDPNGSSPLSVSSDETWDNARAALRVP